MAENKPQRKAPPQKNELKPVYIPESNLYKIKYSGAGSIPDVLSGLYTDEERANTAILLYVNSKKR